MSRDRQVQLNRFQLEVLERLYALAVQIENSSLVEIESKSFVARFFSTNQRTVRGLYLWGGVGRGKTLLMDLFYSSMDTSQKRRFHFHRFMKEVHSQLSELEGTENPLESVAESVASQAKVICMDEFFVSDIGDAMILAELLRALFRRKVVLVATSNTEPKDLYKNGLQRRRFVPAIALLEKHTEVHFLGGEVDYRLQVLQERDLYRIVKGNSSELIEEDMEQLIGKDKALTEPLSINGRQVETVYHVDGTAAFQFEDLCGGPRNASDYLEIGRTFHSVVIYDVPRLSTLREDATRRLISLVDVLYDRNVNLELTAECCLESLYAGAQYEFEWERTKSRIHEMGSREYLSRPHLA